MNITIGLKTYYMQNKNFIKNYFEKEILSLNKVNGKITNMNSI